VYAPCGSRDKEALWASLSAQLLLLRGKRVCVRGDFNAVRKTEERRSVRREQVSNDHAAFNSFIEDNGLQDLPLFGRIFT